ncbi:hypothetical protein FB45DRAFT_1067533 [Roridomyces roridus]|uniref:F-box domain-containing protein n=1 Tax=Roridomyces roridus TaxID=1738132 RepID=A0AAD7B280_9AGAR|nr:hypothetical protein FB45DRAFT_1067533 [Roridomyces roridus]
MDDLPVPKGLQFLSPHSGRIVRLTIVVRTHQALDTILTSFRNVAMPSLENLDIESHRDIDLLDMSPLNSPNITSLKMTRCTPAFPPPQWMVALTHLHLKNNPYPVRENSDIFRFMTTQLPSLIYLYLDLTKGAFGSGNGIVYQSLAHVELVFHESETNALFNQLASFDTPHLTHLSLHHIHGDQDCHCEAVADFGDDYRPITTPPRLFPVISSLTLIRECFTPRIVSDLLGPGSQPWPQLEVLALRPMAADVENLYKALQEVVCCKRSQQESLPTFKLSPNLFEREFWAENGVVVELLEEPSIIGSGV